MVSLESNHQTETGISIVSWPALLSCVVALCGIAVIARASYELGNVQNQSIQYRRNLFVFLSGALLLSCAVAINKFVE